jgi:hypothetical protein
MEQQQKPAKENRVGVYLKIPRRLDERIKLILARKGRPWNMARVIRHQLEAWVDVEEQNLERRDY